MSDGSPPPSWYDPPEPRHSDRSIIPPECSCEECHDYHVEEGLWEEQAGSPDYPCCTEYMAERIEHGLYCEKHKVHTDNEDCEECEKENGNQNVSM